jgi:hypothetical protein
MIPIVDAHSGKIVQVGEPVRGGERSKGGYIIDRVEVGLFSAKAYMRDGLGDAVVKMPIKFLPKLIYGPRFPVGGLRAAIFPS